MEKCWKLNLFCYVCGIYVPKRSTTTQKTNFTSEFKNAYLSYYSDQVDLFDCSWTPDVVCRRCFCYIFNWINRKPSPLPHGTPVIWTDPKGHDENTCYGCINFKSGMNRKKMANVVYIPGPHASLPQLNSDANPPPRPPSPDKASVWTAGTFDNVLDDPLFAPDEAINKPELVTQREMNYVVAKLGLSKRKSEFLSAFLKRKKLTDADVKTSIHRNRQAEFQKFFSVNDENTYTYCNNIKGLANEMGLEYIAEEWRLFIDSSVTSLKAVLLHKSNLKPSIPLAFSTDLKECYATMEILLRDLKYSENLWKICCDLKVVNILQGIKGGWPKYYCFLCRWDTRAKLDHYSSTWEKRKSGVKDATLDMKAEPLIKNINDILLPPLHIKLGITKKFLETIMKNNENIFHCLKKIFPKLSDQKIKAGVLNGPDIRKLLTSEDFNMVLHGKDLIAWDALKAVLQRVLGKNRDDDWKYLVKNMLKSFKAIGVTMTLKLHFLNNHLAEFEKQMPTESDEQGERFHQVTLPMEKRFKGKKLDAMLGEVCWSSHKVFSYENKASETVENMFSDDETSTASDD